MIPAPMKRIGLLSVGQSDPIPDSDFQQLPGIEVVDICPLDAYTHTKLLENFSPKPGECPISSNVTSGAEILLSHSMLERELQKGVLKAEALRLDAIVVTFSSRFKLASSSLQIVFPNQVLRAKVLQRTWGEAEKVAIIVPMDEMQGRLEKRWKARLPSEKSLDIKAFTLNWQASLKETQQLASELLSNGFRFAIMDCFGYSVSHSREMEKCGIENHAAKAEVINKLVTDVF